MPKVFLLGDQPVLLVGFEHALRQHDFDVVGRGQTTRFPVALRSATGAKPDAILLDITAGLTFISLGELHQCAPDCPVVLWADVLPLELMFKTLE